MKSNLGEDVVRPSFHGETLSPQQVAEAAEILGVDKAGKKAVTAFLLAISAGVFIALAFVFCITVLTGADSMPWGVSRLLGGLVFSTGLILLVICGGELFTSSILSCVACASGRIDVQQMLKNWALVYGGNFIGAMLVVVLMTMARVHELADGAWGITLMQMAQHKLHHGFAQALVLGLLCNLMVCLAVWMSFSTRSAAGKAALVALPVALFVSTGFEHVVANMFLLPFAMAVRDTADAAFWLAAGHQAGDFADLTLLRVIMGNLLPVTLGNIAGGLMVGMGYWFIYRRRTTPQVAIVPGRLGLVQRYPLPDVREEVAMQR